jgi:lipopolysaccharide export system permease protein
MFKKLDILIIKAFIGPFIATFFITLLVLLIQFFWLYIDDFVGKGLGAGMILKFIWYQSAVLVPLALPLAILLSSLMTFGNLGESYELVAIKSSGISLLRFMRPLFIIAVFLTGVAFAFSNNVIPVAYLKSRSLLTDIVWAKPAFDLKEGTFYDKLSGFAIKVGKKEANDSVIRDVIVYEQSNNIQDNFIIAKSGIMRVSEDKRYLEFNLKDGWRYQERGNTNGSEGTDYIRLGFDEYKKKFDLSSFMISWTPDSSNRGSERVYSMRQLNKAIDSISKSNTKIRTQLNRSMYTSSQFLRYKDSTSTRDIKHDSTTKKRDSLWKTAKTIDLLLPDSARQMVYQRARDKALSMSTTLEAVQVNLKAQERILRKHKIEWHRKLVYSFACILLFLIGAPLGSIIRKGGLGMPLIISIIFFMVFYFSTTMGEKLGKENTVPPWAGMWLAAFILLPIGIFLTYKAMRDSQLFNKEWYARVSKPLKKFMARRFEKRKKQLQKEMGETTASSTTE